MQLITRWFWLRHAPTLARKGVFIGRGKGNGKDKCNNDPAATIDSSRQEIALLARRVSGNIINDSIDDSFATSSALTGEQGRLSAKLSASLPAKLPASLLITSSLRRARETAAALIDAEPQFYQAMRGLRIAAFDEQSFGAWEGKEYDAHEQRALWEAPDTCRPPGGGESFADLCLRVARAVELLELALYRIATKQGSSEGAGDVVGEVVGEVVKVSIVAVVHAGTIRAALAHALSHSHAPAHTPALALAPVSVAQALAFKIDTLSCTRIDNTYRDDALNAGASKSKRHSLIDCVNARWGLEESSDAKILEKTCTIAIT